MGMTTRAAIVRGPGKQWEIAELDLDEPKAHEVRVKMMASGLCHSDEHIREGSPHFTYPIVGGHEGSGVVEAVGPDVTRVKVGDHIVTSWIPVCGHCRYCSSGRQNLCDDGRNAGNGMLLDDSYRFHEHGVDIPGMNVLGTFAEHTVINENAAIKIDDDLPFDRAALVACGVTTGWGSAVYVAGTRAGDTVVVIGVGGVGINAVQGARYAGAKHLIAIDPVPFKLEMARKLGATFATTDPEEAREHLVEVTRGQLADHAICTVGVMEADVTQLAVSLVGKSGDVVVTAIGRPDTLTLSLSGSPLTGWQKQIRGSLFGGASPLYDMPKMLALYKAGRLDLDSLITKRYTLETINDGFEDMLAGRNVRGVLVHEEG